MIQKRLEINRDDVWFELELYYGEGLKYNNVINKISDTQDRSLSISNTFQIPWTKQNIDALNLNLFNYSDLANALNEKYEAKYFIDNILSEEGFIVINNMDNGIPSLNFVDKALSLVEEWGSTTYKEFLQDDNILLNVSSTYVTAIDAMKSYDMDPNAVLGILGNISGETFPIAYFPNNVNAIGDKFQSNPDESRYDDYFNPYQSRPLFNAQAFLNMVTEAYGYTLVQNTSVDWDKMAVTAICANGLANGEVDEGTQTYQYDTVFTGEAHYSSHNSGTGIYSYQAGMFFPESVGLAPEDITNFPTAPTGLTVGSSWFTERMLFVPNTTGGFSGNIKFVANFTQETPDYEIYVVYEDTTATNAYIIEAVTVDTDDSTAFQINITFDKFQFDPGESTDPDAGNVVGIYLLVDSTNLTGGQGMFNMTVTEEVLSADITTFDDYGQYEQSTVDLTYSTPTKTIKDLINGLLQRFGALIEIDHQNNQVEIFTYDYYATQQTSGNFVDWTEYLQEYVSPNYNTNYGNNYAIKNKVGLGSPFTGNYNERYLGNQVSNSKYKEYGENLNTQFNDVTKLIYVVGTSNTYDEFSIGGASLVEYSYDSGSFSQRRFEDASGVTQGTITGIPFMTFVSFSELPDGLEAWYNVIDSAVRCKPTFLIPQKEMRNLDIKKPIYIGKLGGFYIPEEIIQYEDEVTPVQVKLIKITSELSEGVDDADTAPIESIILFFRPYEFPGNANTNYFIWSSTTFNNYIPTSADLYIQKYTDSAANGGVVDGSPVVITLPLTSYVNDIAGLDYGDTLESGELGWRQCWIQDQSGTMSDIVEFEVEA